MNNGLKDECTYGNCPFAPQPPNQAMVGWGMGPEGWENARIRHQQHCKHANRCADCGKEL